MRIGTILICFLLAIDQSVILAIDQFIIFHGACRCCFSSGWHVFVSMDISTSDTLWVLDMLRYFRLHFGVICQGQLGQLDTAGVGPSLF